MQSVVGKSDLISTVFRTLRWPLLVVCVEIHCSSTTLYYIMELCWLCLAAPNFLFSGGLWFLYKLTLNMTDAVAHHCSVVIGTRWFSWYRKPDFCSSGSLLPFLSRPVAISLSESPLTKQVCSFRLEVLLICEIVPVQLHQDGLSVFVICFCLILPLEHLTEWT